MTRKKHDQYFTPWELANALVERLPCSGRILEPSLGEGAFARAIRRTGGAESITGIDLEEQVFARKSVDEFVLGDFLEHQGSYDWIVGNPPFKHAMAHIRHALELAPNVGFLLRLSMLASAKRAPFWAEGHLRKLWVISQRPSFTGGGTDSADYGLFWLQRELDVPCAEVAFIRRWR